MQVFKGPIFFPVLTYFILEEEDEIKARAHCLWRERLYILNAKKVKSLFCQCSEAHNYIYCPKNLQTQTKNLKTYILIS